MTSKYGNRIGDTYRHTASEPLHLLLARRPTPLSCSQLFSHLGIFSLERVQLKSNRSISDCK